MRIFARRLLAGALLTSTFLISGFAAVAQDMLVRTAVPFTRVSGGWSEREAQVRARLARLMADQGEETQCGSRQD